ncbi:MAG: RNA-directed DNA polymerase [Patescibacteria group bacterium]|nr:RNA-directed DNA polymerase [Patescibacteria group bacterium]
MNDKILKDLFQAYYDTRRNKRNKPDAIRFEMDYERNLLALADEILAGKYEPGPSTCFIVDKPVKREIFAASFRDRVVHHLIYNYINPIFEPRFINDAYSCRAGKGTAYGIKRLDHFIRSCSENYKKECYILKLDIKGYFMSINRNILYNKIKIIIEREYERKRESNFLPPFKWLIELMHKIIFHDPTKNCFIKGRRDDWAGLPKSKSLFSARQNCGLPIGNLTSQLFGNIYLNAFDHFVKGALGIRYYGRYVDDMVFVHYDKRHLKAVILEIKDYLEREPRLELHERKICLQHFIKGVKFLGAFIKPYRIYIDKRTKGNFYARIRAWNNLLAAGKNELDDERTKNIIAAANAYLGLMKHYQAARLRRKMLNYFSFYFWNYFYIKDNVLRKR